MTTTPVPEPVPAPPWTPPTTPPSTPPGWPAEREEILKDLTPAQREFVLAEHKKSPPVTREQIEAISRLRAIRTSTGSGRKSEPSS